MKSGEEKLLNIYTLMKKRLLEEDASYEDLLQRRRKNTFEVNRVNGDSFFFRKMCMCIFASGFKSAIVREKWESLSEDFCGFDIETVASYDESMIEHRWAIDNKSKIRAVISNAKRLQGIMCEYGSFVHYIDSFKDDVEGLAEDLKKFSYVGEINVWDFLKDIGIDAVKPDLHVRRILARLGLTSSEEVSEQTLREVREVTRKMAEVTGERSSVIDAVIWSYGERDLCGTTPKCFECYLINFCKFCK